MRLVDFDDVLRIIKYYGDNYDIEMGMYSSLGISDFIFADVASLTAIETESVKHGVWIPQFVSRRGLSDMFACSICNGLTHTLHKYSRCYEKYCKNCGARMDRGAENECNQ